MVSTVSVMFQKIVETLYHGEFRSLLEKKSSRIANDTTVVRAQRFLQVLLTLHSLLVRFLVFTIVVAIFVLRALFAPELIFFIVTLW
jgi:hypothetical protein